MTSRHGARLGQILAIAGALALGGCGSEGSSGPSGPSSRDGGGTSSRDGGGTSSRDGGTSTPRDDSGRPIVTVTDGGTIGGGDCDIQMNGGTCSDPHTVSGCADAVLRVSNDGRDNEADPSDCASTRTDRPDVVIEYTPPRSGVLVVETSNGELSQIPAAPDGGTVDERFDTIVFVRSSCPGTGDDEIGCNDDGGEERHSLITAHAEVEVHEDSPVYVFMQGYNEDDLGDADVRITVVDPLPPPEPFVVMCTATDVMDIGSQSSVTLSLDGMGTSHGDPTDECSPVCHDKMSGDVILSYTPSATGTLTVSTDHPATDVDTVVTIFGTCEGENSTVLGCDDDSGEGGEAGAMTTLSSIATAEVTSGTPVHIVIGTCNPMQTGTAEVTFTVD